MNFHWSDIITGKSGKISRTAVMFILWFIFLVGMIAYSAYKGNGKLPEIPQQYVYLTLVFSGTYTTRRYLDGKIDATISTSIPPTIAAMLPPKIT